MAITKEQQQDSDKAYTDAYNQDMPAPAQQSDDEAFGITPAAPADGAGPAEVDSGDTPNGEPAAAAAPAATADAPETGSETPEEGAGEPAAAATDAPRDDGTMTVTDEPESMTPDQIKKEVQRLKSWEGRLKAMERDRGASGEPASSPAEPAVAEAANASGGNGDNDGDEMPANAGQAVAEVAEKVESGELTPDQAAQRLSEDFGEDFVKMIQLIAGHTASKAATESVDSKVGELKGAVDDIIADITDTKARAHFEAIAAKHPDFSEIGGSEGFASYIASLPEDKQAEAKRVAESGTAKEIVALLDDYKKSGAEAKPNADAPAADPVIDPAVSDQMDAAEGVRSSGMRLPETPPAAPTSYEEAWANA